MPSPLAVLDVSMDGPYGRMGRFHDHERVLLIAGGIGVTPMIAVLEVREPGEQTQERRLARTTTFSHIPGTVAAFIPTSTQGVAGHRAARSLRMDPSRQESHTLLRTPA